MHYLVIYTKMWEKTRKICKVFKKIQKNNLNTMMYFRKNVEEIH